ncbi:hypothetical protein DFP72DRAFT_1134412, partial [Ephemerocybe angulata]
DDMEFTQHPDFYPAGAPAGKMTSSAVTPRSGDGIRGHPHLSRQNTSQVHGLSLASLAQSNHLGARHDLYPAPPELHQQQREVHQRGSPQSWPPYNHGLAMNMPSGMATSFDSFPSASPYPPPRLSPPTSDFGSSYPLPGRHGPLAGSLDPTTGIFYRTPDHPRLRTAQACEKCRTRKAKCSGDHPSCKRCINRGLVCEYAKEGRVRGPNKPKSKQSPPEDEQATASNRNRSSSTNTSSSTSSSDYYDVPSILASLKQPRTNIPQQTSMAAARSRRPSLSLGEHRASRPRPPNLQLQSSSNH